MAELSTLGLLTAFAAGMVSFLSPCVLPIVPGYVSYVAGGGAARTEPLDAERRRAVLGVSALFVGGFSLVFVALGASASALGKLLLRYRFEANVAAGAIVVLFGVVMLGLWRWVPWLARDFRLRPRLAAGSPLAAFVLGVAFAFGWTPCIGPVLGAILAVGAAGTSAGGVGLLSAYALGLGVPFLLAAWFIDSAGRFTLRLRRFGAALQVAGGLVMVLIGVAIMTGRIGVFALWLLGTFPALGRIG